MLIIRRSCIIDTTLYLVDLGSRDRNFPRVYATLENNVSGWYAKREIRLIHSTLGGE